MIVFRMNSIHELLDLQHSVIAFDRLRGDPKELGVRALLIAEDVTVGFTKEFVARLAVDAQAELITHRAGWNEECGFFAEHRGDLLFQPADGGIVAKNVVTHLGCGHG
jgi:hypothetical protein